MSNSAFELTRKMPLAYSAKEEWQDAARQLMTVEPVIDAQLDQHGILHISYDASSIDINNIASLLDELDLPLKNDFWWKLKLAWYSYVDANAQANARTSGGACCNRPPSVYGESAQTGKANQWHFHK